MDFELEASTTARPVDLHAICRLCLTDRKDCLKSIFDGVLVPNRVPQKIELLMQLQISKNDKLSTMVCNDCIIRLDTWFSYKKQCHRNQKKLEEWLKISNMNKEQNSEELPDSSYSPMPPPLLKVEATDYDEDLNMSGYQTDDNSQLFLEDIDQVETEDKRRCPDCGRLFGSIQNMKRHQNVLHSKKERRSQMAEIRKPFTTQMQMNGTQEETSPVKVEHSTENHNETEEEEKKDADTSIMTSTDGCNATNDEDKQTDQINNESVESMDVSTNKVHEDQSLSAVTKVEENSNLDKKDSSIINGTENNDEEMKNEVENKPIDQKMIAFAAGLNLFQKDSSTFDALSKMEQSYLEKCKAMVCMFQTLQCACHNVQHKSMKSLLSHLRETRLWFPLFTCYNCMISLTDRSTYARHYSRCPRPQYDALKKLSTLKKRSEVKVRLYQNFKCNRCKFLYTFHEDFCKHIDEEHAYGSPPFYCSCRYVFDSLEEYKNHCYTSCIVSYYCDICFVTTSTIEEFVQHAQEAHDPSEGFLLLQENNYVPRSTPVRHKEVDSEANIIEGKRERRRSSIRDPVAKIYYEKEPETDGESLTAREILKLLPIKVPTTSEGWSKVPAKCPLCLKDYSSVRNLVRHYRIHIRNKEVIVPKFEQAETSDNEDSFSCPDCKTNYSASEWKQHLEEDHPMIPCNDCEKEFRFQTDLEQHRNEHLTLKVFRDSKTQAYRSSTMITPKVEPTDFEDSLLLMCEVCDATFDNRDDLTAHKFSEHDASSSFVDMDAEYSRTDPTDIMVSQMKVEEKPFCEYCDKEFSSTRSLREHIVKQHGRTFLKPSEYPKKCDQCDKVLSSGAGYTVHMQMHQRLNGKKEQPSSKYPKQCEYCDKVCMTGASLHRHVQIHEKVTLGELKKSKDEKKLSELASKSDEEESYFTCSKCFKVFAAKAKLKEHMRSHGVVGDKSSSPKAKKRKVLCDLCHVALDGPKELARHKKEEHRSDWTGSQYSSDMENDDATNDSIESGVYYPCDICEESFSSRAELKVHKQEHMKAKLKNHCKYCKISFNSFTDFTKHMHIQHGESAKPKARLEGRQKVDPKPYKCPVCGRGFQAIAAMNTHYGWHKRVSNKMKGTENTPQATASAKLAKRVEVAKKMAVKSEPIEPPEFQCSTCLVELPNDTALQIHIMENHGDYDERMLVPRCNICNKDFDTQEEYDTHKKFHDFLERQKNHQNQMKASKQTSQTPVIQSYQSVSSEPQKKFPCSWCQAVFSRSDTLNGHIRNHHSEHVRTSFECDQCDRVFEKQSSLTLHVKIHQKAKQLGVTPPSSSYSKVYVCSLCNATFNFPKDLRTHTINAHPF